MARTVRDANLETRTARLRLAIRSEPYWRGLEKSFALGYRRRGKGGTWLARRRKADGGYVEHRIGTADDLQDADGGAVLNYAQAQKAARSWWQTEQRREDGHPAAAGPYTVIDALDEYLKAYQRRGGKAIYATRSPPAGLRIGTTALRNSRRGCGRKRRASHAFATRTAARMASASAAPPQTGC
jgi:hypothetical protein